LFWVSLLSVGGISKLHSHEDHTGIAFDGNCKNTCFFNKKCVQSKIFIFRTNLINRLGHHFSPDILEIVFFKVDDRRLEDVY